MIVVFPLQEKWSGLRDTGTKTDPRWGWLGLACETRSGCPPVGECNYCNRYNMLTAAKHDVVYIFANFITMNEEHKSDWSYRYFGMVTTR